MVVVAVVAIDSRVRSNQQWTLSSAKRRRHVSTRHIDLCYTRLIRVYCVCSYSLAAVVVHSGSLGGGHYVTYARRGTHTRCPPLGCDCKWYLFDDAAVREVSVDTLLRVNAYVLFYTKQLLPDEALRRDLDRSTVFAMSDAAAASAALPHDDDESVSSHDNSAVKSNGDSRKHRSTADDDDDDDDVFLMPVSWFERWARHMDPPGRIDMNSVKCQHGRHRAAMRAVPRVVWQQLADIHGVVGAPLRQRHAQFCDECTTVDAMRARSASLGQTLLRQRSANTSFTPLETAWVRQWRAFVAGDDRPPPIRVRVISALLDAGDRAAVTVVPLEFAKFCVAQFGSDGAPLLT